MEAFTFDWAGVLSGAPLDWLAGGILVTLAVSLCGSLLASLLAVGLIGLAIARGRPARLAGGAIVALFRDTPLLLQILFWYFVGFALLPQAWRDWINADHGWARLPGGVTLTSPEFLASAWGLGIFSAAFIAEEVRAGLAAVSPGQREAAEAQGFGHWQSLVFVLLPQGLANAWQPVVGQYLNLMKLSSLATAIGLGEITYQVRQIESYNAHAVEAFAVGTLLYLAIGLVLGQLLRRLGPAWRRRAAGPGQRTG